MVLLPHLLLFGNIKVEVFYGAQYYPAVVR
jgi:hypothetical protein